jgi:hypothetical protein
MYHGRISRSFPTSDARSVTLVKILYWLQVMKRGRDGDYDKQNISMVISDTDIVTMTNGTYPWWSVTQILWLWQRNISMVISDTDIVTMTNGTYPWSSVTHILWLWQTEHIHGHQWHRYCDYDKRNIFMVISDTDIVTMTNGTYPWSSVTQIFRNS